MISLQKSLFLLFVFLIAITNLLVAQAGQLDSSFGEGGKVLTLTDAADLSSPSVLVQEDGKILVFTTVEMEANGRDILITRYLENGQLDQGFNGTGQLTIDLFEDNNEFEDAVLLDNGKILVLGNARPESFQTRVVLIQLLTDGAFDDTFGENGVAFSDFSLNGEYGYTLLSQQGGRYVISGTMYDDTFQQKGALFRFLPDGTADDSFGSNGMVVYDAPIGYNPWLGGLMPDDKIVAGGFVLDAGGSDLMLYRFNSDGAPDTTFGNEGMVQGDFGNETLFAYSMAVQEDYKILLACGVKNGSDRDFGVVRYTEDGQADSGFGNGGIVTTSINPARNVSHAVQVQEDGKILLAGFVGSPFSFDFGMVRYLADGTLDTEFGTEGGVFTDFGEEDTAYGMAIQEDQKIVLAGRSENPSGTLSLALARYYSGLETSYVEDQIIRRGSLTIHPNPASSTVTIEYTLPAKAIVSVELYNIEGQPIQSLIKQEAQTAGRHIVDFQLRPGLEAGAYLIKLSSKGSSITSKLILQSSQ